MSGERLQGTWIMVEVPQRLHQEKRVLFAKSVEAPTTRDRVDFPTRRLVELFPMLFSSYHVG